MAHEKKYGYLPTIASPTNSFTQWEVLPQLIEFAGTFEDNDRLYEALHEHTFQTCLGSKTFKEGFADPKLYVAQIQNGIHRITYPYDAATAKVWYPMPTWNEKFPAVGEYKPPPTVPV